MMNFFSLWLVFADTNPDLFIAPLSFLDVSYIGQLMGYSLKSFGDYVVVCKGLNITHEHVWMNNIILYLYFVSLSAHIQHTMKSCAPLYIHRLAAIQAGGVSYNRGDPNGRCVIIDRDLQPNRVLQLSSVDINPGALKLAGLDTASLQVVCAINTSIHTKSVFNRCVPYTGHIVLV